MRIGIIADSHDNLVALRKAVDKLRELRVERLIHGGDYVAPFTLPILESLAVPVIGVFGNNDGEKDGLRTGFAKFGEIHEPPHVFELEGRRLLLTHHLKDAEETIARQKLNVVIFGHTHRAELRKEGKVIYLNPGECGGWLTGKSTGAVLDLQTMKAEIINF